MLSCSGATLREDGAVAVGGTDDHRARRLSAWRVSPVRPICYLFAAEAGEAQRAVEGVAVAIVEAECGGGAVGDGDLRPDRCVLLQIARRLDRLDRRRGRCEGLLVQAARDHIELAAELGQGLVAHLHQGLQLARAERAGDVLLVAADGDVAERRARGGARRRRRIAEQGGDAIDQGAAPRGIDDGLAVVAGEGLDADILRHRRDRLVALILQIADRLAERIGPGDLLIERLDLLQAVIDGLHTRSRFAQWRCRASSCTRSSTRLTVWAARWRRIAGGRLLQAGVGWADGQGVQRISEGCSGWYRSRRRNRSCRSGCWMSLTGIGW